MSLVQQVSLVAVEDYLHNESNQPLRHEYVDGQVYTMAGASMNHNRITNNLVRLFG
jgi:Uma2 family endonuclease